MLSEYFSDIFLFKIKLCIEEILVCLSYDLKTTILGKYMIVR